MARYWIQFMAPDLSGVLADVCGTDSVSHLDGRLSQYSMQRKAQERADTLRLVAPYLTHYRLVRGESFTREARSVGPFKIKRPEALANG